ncbi:formyltransferase family protein [Lonsdalea quercina]|uniref:formyltransferase family protein n=1 Tax=Lonsdalea quercina TaxID=71657 RepID=UPI003975A6B5
MEMIICLTETFFHTSFLYERLKKHQILWVARNERNLDKSVLSDVHAELSRKSNLTDKDLNILRRAYNGLSLSEEYLAKIYGVPSLHAMSSTFLIDTQNLSEDFLIEHQEEIKKYSPDGAIIFLDVILGRYWLDFFKNRIVNAHSAVLPFARGMYAIEQTAALGISNEMENAAGATIHYVDSGIDTGAIIKSEKIKNLWMKESIWAVKGESYLLAFRLLDDYLFGENKFTLTDAISGHGHKPGPLFMSKTFTPEKQKIAEQRFLEMKEDVMNVRC